MAEEGQEAMADIAEEVTPSKRAKKSPEASELELHDDGNNEIDTEDNQDEVLESELRARQAEIDDVRLSAPCLLSCPFSLRLISVFYSASMKNLIEVRTQ